MNYTNHPSPNGHFIIAPDLVLYIADEPEARTWLAADLKALNDRLKTNIPVEAVDELHKTTTVRRSLVTLTRQAALERDKLLNLKTFVEPPACEAPLEDFLVLRAASTRIGARYLLVRENEMRQWLLEPPIISTLERLAREGMLHLDAVKSGFSTLKAFYGEFPRPTRDGAICRPEDHSGSAVSSTESDKNE